MKESERGTYSGINTEALSGLINKYASQDPDYRKKVLAGEGLDKKKVQRMATQGHVMFVATALSMQAETGRGEIIYTAKTLKRALYAAAEDSLEDAKSASGEIDIYMDEETQSELSDGARIQNERAEVYLTEAETINVGIYRVGKEVRRRMKEKEADPSRKNW